MPTMSNSATIIEPVHPGEVLGEDFLKPLSLSANALARQIGVPGNRISAIVGGQRGISGETALRLAGAFGTTPEFWMNLQMRYELEKARDLAREGAVDFDALRLSAVPSTS